jgi:hypothetical protein
MARPLLAQVALDANKLPGASDVFAALQRVWSDAPEPADVKFAEDLLTFRLGEHTAAISLRSESIPRDDWLGPAATAWYWPEAALELQSHAAHAIVGLLPSRVDRLDAAMLLTRITAAVAVAAEAVAVLWSPGRLVHSPSAFFEYAEKMTRRRLPLYLWINFGLQRNSDGSHALATTGLEAFGHLEIEVAGSSRQPKQLLDMVFNVAHYVLAKGSVLQSGETLGTRAEEKIAIERGPSFRDPSTTVVQLDL